MAATSTTILRAGRNAFPVRLRPPIRSVSATLMISYCAISELAARRSTSRCSRCRTATGIWPDLRRRRHRQGAYAYAAYGVCQFFNPEYSSLSLSAYDSKTCSTLAGNLIPNRDCTTIAHGLMTPGQGRFMQLDPFAFSGGAGAGCRCRAASRQIDSIRTVRCQYTVAATLAVIRIYVGSDRVQRKTGDVLRSACMGYRGWSGSWYGLPELHSRDRRSRTLLHSAACIPAVIATGVGRNCDERMGSLHRETGQRR